MKRVWILAALVAVPLGACGSQDTPKPAAKAFQGAKTEAEPPKLEYTQDNVSDLANATDDDDVKDAAVTEITGKVFDVQKDNGQIGVQMYTDPENSEGNVIVLLGGDAKVHEGDFITVSGTGLDVLDGENGLGNDVQVPRVEGTDWETADPAILKPAQKTYRPAQTQDLAGVAITVRKIEVAEDETRVYVRFRNSSADDFYTAPDSLTAGGEEVESSYTDDYKDPAGDLSPGASTKGVLVFDAVDPDDVLRLTWEGTDANYDEVKTTFTYGD